MKKTILHSFVGSMVFCLTCFGILYLTKARSSSNPGTTDSDPSALYVNNNETLTAAKRNTMVDNSFTKKINLITCAISGTASTVLGCSKHGIVLVAEA